MLYNNYYITLLRLVVNVRMPGLAAPLDSINDDNLSLSERKIT